MATLDAAGLLQLATGGQPMTGAGFTMAGNALQRAQITENMGEMGRRVENDYLKYSLPALASQQAARGAFHSGGTALAGEQMQNQYIRTLSDINRPAAFSLAKLGLSDWGTKIPGLNT